MENDKKKVAISIGGSLIYPKSGLSIKFLSELNSFVRAQIKKDPNLQFFLVAGGGGNFQRVQGRGQKRSRT